MDSGAPRAFRKRSRDYRRLQNARESAGLNSLSPHFRVIGGHKFLEIAPQLATKREAVTYILQTYPFDWARLLYIGDDDKDEDAFPVIHDHNGLAIKILQPSQLSQPTEADAFFENPRDTLEWLRALV